jgi:hypothetical protein
VGQSTRSRLTHGKLPRDIENELSSVHIERVWELLHDTFCFNEKAWKKQYHEYFKKLPHEVSEEEAFVEFGAEFINPLLNQILQRAAHHDTWGNMLKYVVRKH